MDDIASTTDNSAITSELTSETPEGGNQFSRLWIRLFFLMIACAILYFPGTKLYRSQKDKAFKSACKAAVEQEDWKGLLETSNRWRNWNPQQGDALIFLAEAHVQLGEFEQAAERLGQVDDSYHGALQALAARAELLYIELRQPYAAEETWLRMLNVNKLADVPRQRLIYFYAMSLQRKKMLDLIHESMQLGCEPLESYTYLLIVNSLNFSDGLVLMTRWLQSAPGDETFEVAQAVYAAKKTADNAMATFGIQTLIPGDRSLLDKSLQKYPANLEALAIQIDFLIFEGDAEQVAKLISQASPDAEFDSRFWRYRAWLLSNRQRHQDAADSLKQALELNPYDWQARWLLADVYRKLGKAAEADQVAKLGRQGKELQSKLFELPNARQLTEEVAAELIDYLRAIGPSPALEAIERRL